MLMKQMNISSEVWIMLKLDSNTNIKLKFFFADVSVETKRIASLTVKAYSSTWGNSDMTFNFRDLPVEWK